MVREWEKIAREEIFPRLPAIVDGANALKNPIAVNAISDSINNDQFEEEIDTMMDDYELLLLILLIPFPQAMERVSQDVSSFNDRQWKKIVKHSLGIDLFKSEPWLSSELASFVSVNLALMNKLKNDIIADIKSIINTFIRQGKKTIDIQRQITVGTQGKKGIFHKGKNRAILIGRDQTEKLNGELQKIRQTEFGVTQFIWNTRRDDRVRDMHVPLEGKICSWKNSTIYFTADGQRRSRNSINATLAQPGEDINCRCSGGPLFNENQFADIILQNRSIR